MIAPHWSLACVLIGQSFSSLSASETANALNQVDARVGWQRVTGSFVFADGLTVDGRGDTYVCDIRSKPAAIWKLSPEYTMTKLAEGTACSGLKFGPDGRLYACASADREVAAFAFPNQIKSVLARDVQPNDLVVSAAGEIYITETGKQQVTRINIQTAEKRVMYAARGLQNATLAEKRKGPPPYDPSVINAPNGIALSPDGNLLFVSDMRGLYVWAFTVASDGALLAPRPFLKLKTRSQTDRNKTAPMEETASGADGMAIDTRGHYYVTTDIGLQVFDADGEVIDVLPNASTHKMTSVCLAGAARDTIFVACGPDLFFQPVPAQAKFDSPKRSSP